MKEKDMVEMEKIEENYVKYASRRKVNDTFTARSVTLGAKTSIIFSMIAIALFFLAALSSAVIAVQDLMALQGSVNDNGNPINNGNLTVTIWTQISGGSLVYNSSADYLGVINNGRFDIMLGDGSNQLSLEYGKMYYMDMMINNQDLSFNGSSRRMFQSGAGNVNWSYIVNVPSYVRDYSGDISAKLDATDQRYNDSALATSANSTASSALSLATTANSTANAANTTANSALSLAATANSTANAANSTAGGKASPGTCAAGTIVQNTTTGGVQCVSAGGAGTVTSVTRGFGFNNTGTSISSTGTLDINTSIILAATDQRYNDSAAITAVDSKISSVNTSANIKSFGFNLTSELKTYFDTLYYGASNPSSFIASSISVLSNFYNKTDMLLLYYNKTDADARYLQLTDQRFNDSALATSANSTATTANTLANTANTTANSVSARESSDNSTQATLINAKLDATDQRYNDSALASTANTTANTINARESADNSTQAALISSLDSRESANNITQASLISALDSRESSNNATQGALISSLDSRESANNATQGALISAKLDATDQRYNDSALVNGKADLASVNIFTNSAYFTSGVYCFDANSTCFNTTTNVWQSNDTWNITGTILGYNTTSQLDSRYVQSVPYQSSAAGWINGSSNTNTSLNVNIGGNTTYEGYIDMDASISKPPAPSSNYTRVFPTKIAGRNMLSVMGSAGIDYTLAPSSIDRRTALIIPPGTGAVFTMMGDSATITSATATTPAFVMADGLTLNMVATASTGSGVSGNAIWARNLSTFAYFRFKGVEGGGIRMFAGLTNLTMASMAISDSLAGNFTGVRVGGVFTNWTLVSGNGTVQINYTLPLLYDNNTHELKIWLPNTGQCYVQFDSYQAYNFSSSQCPDNNVLLRYAVGDMNTTAALKNIRIGRIYLEAER